jgi:hypothetical protein
MSKGLTDIHGLPAARHMTDNANTVHPSSYHIIKAELHKMFTFSMKTVAAAVSGWNITGCVHFPCPLYLL